MRPTSNVPDVDALRTPVGIFDAGIGSYDLVRRIRAAHPEQDVLYLADRASFPYGTKSRDDLLTSVERATHALEALGASSIVLASNAPSVTILEPLRARVRIPILGVFPPVRGALASIPADRTLAVAGATVLVRSPALGRLIHDAAGREEGRVHVVTADDLIALVESGAFLERRRAEGAVAEFLASLRERHPRLGGLCLSSTHLPWLAPTIAAQAPDLHLFDPADQVVAAFAPLATQGSGRLVSLATSSPAHPFEEFLAMSERLRLDISPTLIEI